MPASLCTSLAFLYFISSLTFSSSASWFLPSSKKRWSPLNLLSVGAISILSVIGSFSFRSSLIWFNKIENFPKLYYLSASFLASGFYQMQVFSLVSKFVINILSPQDPLISISFLPFLFLTYPEILLRVVPQPLVSNLINSSSPDF